MIQFKISVTDCGHCFFHFCLFCRAISCFKCFQYFHLVMIISEMRKYCMYLTFSMSYIRQLYQTWYLSKLRLKIEWWTWRTFCCCLCDCDLDWALERKDFYLGFDVKFRLCVISIHGGKISIRLLFRVSLWHLKHDNTKCPCKKLLFFFFSTFFSQLLTCSITEEGDWTCFCWSV